jgi:GrpB-like predicted nucleotidyltransferase (UPF0157 family)
MPQPVTIEDYNPAWTEWFEMLRAMVGDALQDLAVAIEHVGSTAVPGLAAKPIVDIDVVIPTRSDLIEAIRRMAAIGYLHEGDLGVADREAFAHPPGLPVHHLYVCSRQSPELQRHLLFRDFLRLHPQEMQAYAELKRVLAKRFHNDRESYAVAKSDFVNAALQRAAGNS